MKNTFLPIATLLLAGTLSANAWTESQKTKIWEQDTDKVKYTYTQEQKLTFTEKDTATTGAANEVQIHGNSNMKVDFTQDARYEITFEMVHDKGLSDTQPASGMLSMVNTSNDVCIVFGNSPSVMSQTGVLLYADVPNTPALESLAFGSAGKQVWTSPGNINYGDGHYQYTIIFETFADSSINDKIYFGVKNETTGANTYFLILNSSHLGCGGHTEQVFDDIGFHLIGDAAAPGGNKSNVGDVTFVGSENGTPQNSFTKWTRTAENVPEPSAFGLLAGIGALALVASRRRR